MQNHFFIFLNFSYINCENVKEAGSSREKLIWGLETGDLYVMQLRFLCLCVVAVMCNLCLALTTFIFVCLSWSMYTVPGISFSFFFLYFTFLPSALTSLSVLTLLDLSNLSGRHNATTPFAGANSPLVQNVSFLDGKNFALTWSEFSAWQNIKEE